MNIKKIRNKNHWKQSEQILWNLSVSVECPGCHIVLKLPLYLFCSTPCYSTRYSNYSNRSRVEKMAHRVKVPIYC